MILSCVRRALAAGLFVACTAVPALSAVLIEIREVGDDVIARTTGALDLGGIDLSDGVFEQGSPFVSGNTLFLNRRVNGAVGFATALFIVTPPSSPPTFATALTTADQWSGDHFGVTGNVGVGENWKLTLDPNFQRGEAIFGTTTWLNTDFSTLELVEGTTSLSLLSGETVTIDIDADAVFSAVPLPAPLLMLGSALLGLVLLGRRKAA